MEKCDHMWKTVFLHGELCLVMRGLSLTSIGSWCIYEVHNHMHPKCNGRQEEGPQPWPEAPFQINQHHILLVAGHCTWESLLEITSDIASQVCRRQAALHVADLSMMMYKSGRIFD